VDDDRALRLACCDYSVRATKALATASESCHNASGKTPTVSAVHGDGGRTDHPVHSSSPDLQADDGSSSDGLLPYVFQFTEAVAQRRRPWGAPAGNSDY
jgi:hypothetical protein